MDQGIIQALKAKYRSLAVCKLILALEKKEPIDTKIFHSFSDVHAVKNMGCYLEPDIHQLLQKIGNFGEGC